MIDSYDKLTINKYKELIDINNSELKDYEKNIAIVSILSDKDIDEVMNMPITEYNELLQKTKFLEKKPHSRIMAVEYRLGDYILEPVVEVGKLTTVQFVDYQIYIKEFDKYMLEILSIFLIPKGKKYKEGYDIEDVRETIGRELSIVDAMSMSAFFLTLFQALLKVTVTCLEKQMKKPMKMMTEQQRTEMKKRLVDLRRSGDGLALLIEQVK